MKNPTPYYAPMSSPTLLYYLMQERPAVEKLAMLDRIYEPLLRLLLILPLSAKLPTGKALQQQLSISQVVYRRWLESWEGDFWSLALAENSGFLDFRPVEHIFELPRGKYGTGATFRCQLAVTPRVGEAVVLPFVPVRYFSTYYVDSVQHEYHNGKTEITIELREGRYNSHLRLLRHRARFKQELWSVDESIDDPDLARYFREEEIVKPSPILSAPPRGRRGPNGLFKH